MVFAIRGIGLLIGTPRLWPYAWKPLIGGAFVFGVILIGGYFVAVPALRGLLASIGVGAEWSHAFAAMAYAAIWAVFAGVIFVAIAGLLSSHLWDRLSREVEREAFGTYPDHRLSWRRAAADTFIRAPFSLVMGIAAIAGGLATGGVLAVVFVGLLGLYDFTAPAFFRRSVTFPEQASRAMACRGWFGFMIANGVISLFPIVNVLLMPGLVAGATLMVAQNGGTADRKRPMP